MKDVARVELGAQTYDQFNMNKGRPTANIGIYQLPGANALDVAEQVKAALQRLSESFPEGMAYEIPLDTTKFVEASIHEVYKTLIEAGVLVLIVILVFLQDWRAMLIPATTVPVTIIGAFAAMAALGFTVNMLTLFGLVLAIGIVVDDAIVIVENAAHHIEQGMAPQAGHDPGDVRSARTDHRHHAGADGGVSAERFPGRHHRQLYRQFALTIAATALISAINAVTLKPAQCALWLRPPQGTQELLLSRVQRGVRPLRTVLRGDRAAARAACGVGDAGLLSACASSRPGGTPACRPASCRPKTRATCSSACSCPTRRRRSGRAR